MASSHEIELKQEYDSNPQFCDPIQISETILTPVLLPNLSNIFESVLIPIPFILELETPILYSHIPWRENEFLDLDPLPEQILTLESLLDFSQFSK